MSDLMLNKQININEELEENMDAFNINAEYEKANNINQEQPEPQLGLQQDNLEETNTGQVNVFDSFISENQYPSYMNDDLQQYTHKQLLALQNMNVALPVIRDRVDMFGEVKVKPAREYTEGIVKLKPKRGIFGKLCHWVKKKFVKEPKVKLDEAQKVYQSMEKEQHEAQESNQIMGKKRQNTEPNTLEIIQKIVDTPLTADMCSKDYIRAHFKDVIGLRSLLEQYKSTLQGSGIYKKDIKLENTSLLLKAESKVTYLNTYVNFAEAAIAYYDNVQLTKDGAFESKEFRTIKKKNLDLLEDKMTGVIHAVKNPQMKNAFISQGVNKVYTQLKMQEFEKKKNIKLENAELGENTLGVYCDKNDIKSVEDIQNAINSNIDKYRPYSYLIDELVKQYATYLDRIGSQESDIEIYKNMGKNLSEKDPIESNAKIDLENKIRDMKMNISSNEKKTSYIYKYLIGYLNDDVMDTSDRKYGQSFLNKQVYNLLTSHVHGPVSGERLIEKNQKQQENRLKLEGYNDNKKIIINKMNEYPALLSQIEKEEDLEKINKLYEEAEAKIYKGTYVDFEKPQEPNWDSKMSIQERISILEKEIGEEKIEDELKYIKQQNFIMNKRSDIQSASYKKIMYSENKRFDYLKERELRLEARKIHYKEAIERLKKLKDDEIQQANQICIELNSKIDNEVKPAEVVKNKEDVEQLIKRLKKESNPVNNKIYIENLDDEIRKVQKDYKTSKG
ncbi:hypothetical protein SAMN05216351_101303 [Pseudobutyrivibrio sp. JW11]|uniref:hypothetical protein n=1 Tax=Pseudobutyrivibrio sp. JW11 TaxID=1855302 RepID=UPI0008F27502|nr:hypothetical protein [Pseudobutyrivibrio sp. JW11]SFN83019.1 hypothetical protein SAMN05216351_101303 [Pseudobutyrivibrio sp. JW11]